MTFQPDWLPLQVVTEDADSLPDTDSGNDTASQDEPPESRGDRQDVPVRGQDEIGDGNAAVGDGHAGIGGDNAIGDGHTRIGYGQLEALPLDIQPGDGKTGDGTSGGDPGILTIPAGFDAPAGAAPGEATSGDGALEVNSLGGTVPEGSRSDEVRPNEVRPNEVGLDEVRAGEVQSDDAAPPEDIPRLDVESLSFQNLHDRVTIMLLFEQVVTSEQVQRVWQTWSELPDRPQEPLWRSFTREAGVDRDRVFAVAATVYAFPEHSLDVDAALEFLRENRQLFTETQWERMRSASVLPVARGLNSTSGLEQLVFVTYDPASAAIRQFLSGLNLRSHDVRFVSEKVMTVLLRRAFSKRSEYLERVSSGKVVHKKDSHYEEDDGVDDEALEAEINRSALLALFDAMLVEAVREGASDIHVVPGESERLEVYFRIDGELQCWHVEDHLPSTAFMAIVKDQAHGVDRFERDAAQDGSMQRRIDGTVIRFRLSILPVASATGHVRSESVVIRVLDDRKVTAELTELGLSDLALQRFEKALRQPYGMFILTGPTGSGKSTTLRAALHHIVSPRRNVITVEDPVEYMVPGVRQIRISHKLPVEDAIRYILRHDPDVVMVGEMRDRTTAELAVKLSATGHLTFSTLHTNDAASAVGRLYKMGIEPYLLAYSINLIAAQRLVRLLCPACKRPHDHPTAEMLQYAGLSEEDAAGAEIFTKGEDTSCPTCGGAGYKGRRAVAEVLELSDEIRSMIVGAGEQINEQAVRDQARKEGMLTLHEAAQRLVRSGVTSIGEIIRVTGE